MAEFIFKKMLNENGLADRVFVSSCATSTETIWHGQGEPVYPPAAKELSKHGIDCREKRSVQLQKSDYDKYDMLICMDSYNIRNAMRILGSDPQQKLCKLMEEHRDAHGLGGCVKAWCGQIPENRHRSDGDAYATMLLMQAICKHKHVSADQMIKAYPECGGKTQGGKKAKKPRSLILELRALILAKRGQKGKKDADKNKKA
jgi:protein-tyrosine-phosphatase